MLNEGCSVESMAARVRELVGYSIKFWNTFIIPLFPLLCCGLSMYWDVWQKPFFREVRINHVLIKNIHKMFWEAHPTRTRLGPHKALLLLLYPTRVLYPARYRTGYCTAVCGVMGWCAMWWHFCYGKISEAYSNVLLSEIVNCCVYQKLQGGEEHLPL